MARALRSVQELEVLGQSGNENPKRRRRGRSPRNRWLLLNRMFLNAGHVNSWVLHSALQTAKIAAQRDLTIAGESPNA